MPGTALRHQQDIHQIQALCIQVPFNACMLPQSSFTFQTVTMTQFQQLWMHRADFKPALLTNAMAAPFPVKSHACDRIGWDFICHVILVCFMLCM